MCDRGDPILTEHIFHVTPAADLACCRGGGLLRRDLPDSELLVRVLRQIDAAAMLEGSTFALCVCHYACWPASVISGGSIADVIYLSTFARAERLVRLRRAARIVGKFTGAPPPSG
jgi:hypothetical protein